ncbi:hypothetical protein P8452_76571 [Trifolium repens]|nr:hypothetical protein P8452_76571 [Trifolium repens]
MFHQPSASDIIIGPVHLRTEDIKVHFSSCSQKDFRRTDQASLTSLTVQSSTPILKPSVVNNSANSAAPTLSVQICYCHASFLVPHAFRARHTMTKSKGSGVDECFDTPIGRHRCHSRYRSSKMTVSRGIRSFNNFLSV